MTKWLTYTTLGTTSFTCTSGLFTKTCYWKIIYIYILFEYKFLQQLLKPTSLTIHNTLIMYHNQLREEIS